MNGRLVCKTLGFCKCVKVLGTASVRELVDWRTATVPFHS